MIAVDREESWSSDVTSEFPAAPNYCESFLAVDWPSAVSSFECSTEEFQRLMASFHDVFVDIGDWDLRECCSIVFV